MKRGHVDRIVRDLDVDELVGLLHPALVGLAPPQDVEHGVRRAVRHALTVNALRSGWVPVTDESEFNPLGLLDAAGHRLGLLTRKVRGHWDRQEDPVLVTEDEEPALFRRRPEPAWGSQPPFPASAPIRTPDQRHLFAHPERWPGYTGAQVRARLRRAIREMEHDLRPQDLGAYYYLDSADQTRSGWCWVAPLRLGRSDTAIPAVSATRPSGAGPHHSPASSRRVLERGLHRSHATPLAAQHRSCSGHGGLDTNMANTSAASSDMGAAVPGCHRAPATAGQDLTPSALLTRAPPCRAELSTLGTVSSWLAGIRPLELRPATRSTAPGWSGRTTARTAGGRSTTPRCP